MTSVYRATIAETMQKTERGIYAASAWKADWCSLNAGRARVEAA
jgi:hypothetical protein